MGADSYNIVPANMRGYIPTSVTLTDDEQTSPTWRSTLGAVAIGVSAENADGAITTATQRVKSSVSLPVLRIRMPSTLHN